MNTFLRHFFFSHDFINLLYNLLPLSTHMLFGLQLDSSKIFLESIRVIAMLFLLFKGINNPCVFTENINNA